MFAVSARRTMAGARVGQIMPAPLPPAQDQGPVVEPTKWPVLRSPAQVLIAEIAEAHGISVADLMSRSRKRSCVAARHEAMVRVFLEITIGGRRLNACEVGRIFRRDHTTILHALRKAGVK